MLFLLVFSHCSQPLSTPLLADSDPSLVDLLVQLPSSSFSSCSLAGWWLCYLCIPCKLLLCSSATAIYLWLLMPALLSLFKLFSHFPIVCLPQSSAVFHCPVFVQALPISSFPVCLNWWTHCPSFYMCPHIMLFICMCLSTHCHTTALICALNSFFA